MHRSMHRERCAAISTMLDRTLSKPAGFWILQAGMLTFESRTLRCGFHPIEDLGLQPASRLGSFERFQAPAALCRFAIQQG